MHQPDPPATPVKQVCLALLGREDPQGATLLCEVLSLPRFKLYPFYGPLWGATHFSSLEDFSGASLEAAVSNHHFRCVLQPI